MNRISVLASNLAPLVLALTAEAAIPWHHSLTLGNGGYWPERVAVTVSNLSTEPVSAEPLRVSLPGLGGVAVQSLRVCRSDGVELLFDVRDSSGTEKRKSGLDAHDQLILPVECPAGAAVTLFVYAANAEAWPVPDFLPARFSERAEDARGKLSISVGQVQRLQLRPAAAITPRTGANWRDWAEVRVRSFEQELSRPLVRVNLREALALLPRTHLDPVPRVATRDGTEQNCFWLGNALDLLFSAELPPNSEELFQIGFAPTGVTNAIRGLDHYEPLLDSARNLVPNGNFEQGTDGPNGWIRPAEGGSHRVKAGFSADCRFGSRALELTVADNSQGDWVGWHSREIPVKPGATYLLSGWLKSAGLQSWAAIHAHFHAAHGALTKTGAMVSTQPTVSGDSTWVNSRGFFQAPPDAATLEIHLTMNTQGTLRHDGLVLCEVVDGRVERVHGPAETARATALRVWEVNPLVKVFPGTVPQEQARAVAVELGGNEYQAFQLALRTAGTGTSHVSVAVSPLQNEQHGELPPVTIERVAYVPVDYPSAYYTTETSEWCRKVPRGSGATDGWAGWWPDPLAPGAALEVSPGHTQPLWFTVHAPTTAAPGRYRAEISVSSGSARPIRLPLTVTVLPFSLPQPGHLSAIFDFRFGPGGGFGSGADSAADYRRWLRFIAEHRLGLNEIKPPPKFSYHNGKVTMDAAEFDETAHYCFDELGMNVAYTPDFFYMFGWAYPPKKLFGLAPFTPGWESALQQAYRLFVDHVRQKGWHDKFVYYVSDEPHFEQPFVVDQMKKLCALVHEVDPTVPIYSSTWRYCPGWDESLDLWGIGQYGCFPLDQMARLQRAGKHMWFTCDGQMATDTPVLATERLLPYYCFKYGVRGFEFWGLAWWTYNPWQVGWHQFIRQSDEGKKYYWIRYPDGDGFLTYPGKAVGVDGPASTIRLEQIRQGLQDYEALVLLSDLASKAKQTGADTSAAERALSLARDLVTIPNAGGLRSTELLPDPERVSITRRAVNAALVRLIAASGSRNR